ncbi:MAG: acetyltransferase [Gammaproteobacteria bacterium]|nr:MAG: acetyltransferase [Gammaproteobacteria bacterium]
MHTKLIFLIGAGGHAKVVFDAILLNEISQTRVRITDRELKLKGKEFFDCKIEVPEVGIEMANQLFHLAIGNNRARENIFNQLSELNAQPLTITHPDASISRFSKIEAGAFIAAKAVVGPDAHIGLCSIVNHGAVVDHDCIIGNFSHIAPNATIGGGVTIGSHVLIGAGANILPGIHIGDGSIVGAGSVVTSNIGPGEVKVGIPAKKLFRS